MQDGVPQQIGRYTVDRLLGAGAMGFVYLGRDPDLDRPVAIKTIRNLNLENDLKTRFLERFRNEARAAARLQHANIVQVYDVGEDAKVGPYLVFEYVAGSTLKKRLKTDGALPPTQVLRLAEEIAEALDLAHAAEIIHRDIKPDNLLVTPEGRTKLADFGVARVPNAALTREGQFLGTPCYAAPETLGEGAYSVQSDLFSFGAVLYEVVTGRRAFPGDEALAVAHKVIHDNPESPRAVADHPSMVPPAVDKILLDALSKRPEERAGSAGELAVALRQAYLDSGLVEEDRPQSRRVVLATPQEEPKRGGFWFAIIVIVIAGIAAILWMNRGEVEVEPITPVSPVVVDAGTDVEADVIVVLDAPEDISGGDVRDAREEAEDTGEDTLDTADTMDAGLDTQPDVNVPGLDEMSPHDREEAAKDALDRARAALAAENMDVLRRALMEAELLDPTNPDIADLRSAAANVGSSESPEPETTNL